MLKPESIQQSESTGAAGPASQLPDKDVRSQHKAEAIVEHATVGDETGARPATSHRLRAPSLHRYSRRLLISIVVVLGLRTFVGEASVVPTGSMEHTVLIGDHILLDKLLYGPEVPLVDWRLPRLKTIQRGDIVVFRYPKDPSQTFIKRVAAIGGDRLEIRDGIVYLNARPIVEPYAFHQRRASPVREQVGPLTVPPDSLFVMGDNRDDSSDSRDWGFVPLANVIGEPMLIYWSYDAPTADWLEQNFARQLAFDASIAGNFLRRTRWSRTGLRF